MEYFSIKKNYIVRVICFKYFKSAEKNKYFNRSVVGLGDLGVTCSPRDPRFAAEVDEFFSGRKNPHYKSSGRDFKLEVPSLKNSGSLKNLKP